MSHEGGIIDCYYVSAMIPLTAFMFNLLHRCIRPQILDAANEDCYTSRQPISLLIPPFLNKSTSDITTSQVVICHSNKTRRSVGGLDSRGNWGGLAGLAGLKDSEDSEDWSTGYKSAVCHLRIAFFSPQPNSIPKHTLSSLTLLRTGPRLSLSINPPLTPRSGYTTDISPSHPTSLSHLYKETLPVPKFK